MKRALVIFALATLISAAVVHFVVVDAMPRYVMARAMSGFEAAGLTRNRWASAPRVTPRTQTVVRASPDLSYAICLLDLGRGPVRISVPRWDHYGSLSVFDHTTTNVLVTGLQGTGGPVELILARAGQDVPDGMAGDVIRLPGDRALALVRRLAPADDLHKQATALVTDSVCAAG